MRHTTIFGLLLLTFIASGANAHDYTRKHDHHGDLGRIIISYVLGGAWCHEHRARHTHHTHYLDQPRRGHVYVAPHSRHTYGRNHYNYRDYDAYRHGYTDRRFERHNYHATGKYQRPIRSEHKRRHQQRYQGAHNGPHSRGHH